MFELCCAIENCLIINKKEKGCDFKHVKNFTALIQELNLGRFDSTDSESRWKFSLNKCIWLSVLVLQAVFYRFQLLMTYILEDSLIYPTIYLVFLA